MLGKRHRAPIREQSGGRKRGVLIALECPTTWAGGVKINLNKMRQGEEVRGISWHYSHPVERVIELEANLKADHDAIAKGVTEAVREGFQSWEIRRGLVYNWLDPVVDRRELAGVRAAAVARADGWPVAIR